MAEYSYVLENTRKTAKHSKVGSSLSTYVELCLFDIMGYCVCYLRASFTGKKKQFTLESPPTVQDSSQTRNRQSQSPKNWPQSHLVLLFLPPPPTIADKSPPDFFGAHGLVHVPT